MRNQGGSGELYSTELSSLGENCKQNSVFITLTNRCVDSIVISDPAELTAVYWGFCWFPSFFFSARARAASLVNQALIQLTSLLWNWPICAFWIEPHICFASMISEPGLEMTPGRMRESVLISSWNSSTSYA